MSHPWGIRLLHLRSSGPFMGEKQDCSEGWNYVSARGHETAYRTKRRLPRATRDALTLLQG